MNKNEVISLLASYLQQAVDFSVAKAPEVLQQYIGLQLMITFMVFVFGCVALLFAALYTRRAYNKRGEHDQAWIILFLPLSILLILVVGSGLQCLAIWLYPEGWLLSYFLTK